MQIRRLAVSTAAAALAVATFAGSVSAVTLTGATVFMVNGLPGSLVDVCVNGHAVKSNVRYGQQFSFSRPAATYKMRVWAHRAVPCHGLLLSSKSLVLTDGLNETVVARYVSGHPALTVFTNDLTGTSVTDATITIRHTATLGPVDVWINGGASPAVSSLARGASSGPAPVAAGVTSWWASAVGGFAPVIGPRVAKLVAGTAYQIYAIGTKLSNYRFVVVRQPGV